MSEVHPELQALIHRVRATFPGASTAATDFLLSSLTDHQPDMSSTVPRSWIDERQRCVVFRVRSRALTQLDGWITDEGGNLRHETGRFFSVEALKVKWDSGEGPQEWLQPILNQPEIGILGLLGQRRDGILRFLMQAKLEPGNVNGVQLSPTVQATRSNYTLAHGGKLPPYTECFLDTTNSEILVDQVQSEQGSRFFHKKNRNVAIVLPDDARVELLPNFCWMTLRQLHVLLDEPNLVNMDTRTVLACLPPLDVWTEEIDTAHLLSPRSPHWKHKIAQSCYPSPPALHSFASLQSWLTILRTAVDFAAHLVPLGHLDRWHRDDMRIRHPEGAFFEVLGVHASIGDREVADWCQPLMKQVTPGLVAFIVKPINGIWHLLAQAKMEPGCAEIIEIGPTVQITTPLPGESPASVPFAAEILNARGVIHYDVVQSEEGGRFFHEGNRHVLMEMPADFENDPPRTYRWMTFGQLHRFITIGHSVNIEARSLMACLSPY